MNVPTKFGVAILVVAFLVLNPLTACAAMMSKTASVLSHPCCPAPAQANGESPICCLATAPAPVVLFSTGDTGEILLPLESGAVAPTDVAIHHSPATEPGKFLVDELFVTFHQFLI